MHVWYRFSGGLACGMHILPVISVLALEHFD
jgi:hypothetical protein